MHWRSGSDVHGHGHGWNGLHVCLLERPRHATKGEVLGEAHAGASADGLAAATRRVVGIDAHWDAARHEDRIEALREASMPSVSELMT